MTIVIPPGRISNAISFVGSAWTAGWLKLVLIAVVLGGGAWWFRIWLNKHDDRIFEDGKQRAIQSLETQYAASWKQRIAEAKAMAEAAARDKAEAEAIKQRIDAKFTIVFDRLDAISSDVKKRDVIYAKQTDAIPAAELDGALRVLSDAIARQWPVR